MLRPNRLFLLGLSVAACLCAQNAPPIDNDQVHVVMATDKPHEKHALHEHKLNRVMIYLTAGEQEIISQDGKKTVLKFKPGDVKWSPASGMHTSEVTSNATVNIVELEVKKPGNPAKKADATPLDPPKISPKNYKVEFENDQVRVMRVHFAPHASVPQHEHLLNRAVVYLTAQHSKLTSSDGKVEDAQHQPGQVSWGGPVKHTEENLLPTALEVIVVEFKN